MSAPRMAIAQSVLSIGILCLLLPAACQATPTDPSDDVLLLSGSLSEMVQQLKQSVVRISSGDRVGSGAIVKTVDGTAYIVTNQHVIADGNNVRVSVNDLTTYDATLVGMEADRDVAFLTICCDFFRAVLLADSSLATSGDEVLAIGYPTGAVQGAPTVTRGIISAVGPHPYYPFSDVIQTDAALNPGNSGGPVFNMDGYVVGIATFKQFPGQTTPAERLGFAVPSNLVRVYAPILGAGDLPRVSSPTVSSTPDDGSAPVSTQQPVSTATPKPTATPAPCAQLTQVERVRWEESQSREGASVLYRGLLANTPDYQFANATLKSYMEEQFQAYYAQFMLFTLTSDEECVSFPAFMQSYAFRSSSGQDWAAGLEKLFAEKPRLSLAEQDLLEQELPFIVAEALGCCNPVWGSSYKTWLWDRISRKQGVDPFYSFVDDAHRNWRAWFRGEAGTD